MFSAHTTTRHEPVARIAARRAIGIATARLCGHNAVLATYHLHEATWLYTHGHFARAYSEARASIEQSVGLLKTIWLLDLSEF